MEHKFSLSQNKYMWWVSWLSLISCIYALRNNNACIAVVPGGVFITSLNYWRDPKLGWRRSLDVYFVRVSAIYNIIIAYKSKYVYWYYTSFFICFCFSPLSWYYYNKKSYWKSAIAHSLIHVVGNIGNIIMYKGLHA
jgi:hypothetical protein